MIMYTVIRKKFNRRKPAKRTHWTIERSNAVTARITTNSIPATVFLPVITLIRS